MMQLLAQTRETPTALSPTTFLSSVMGVIASALAVHINLVLAFFVVKLILRTTRRGLVETVMPPYPNILKRAFYPRELGPSTRRRKGLRPHVTTDDDGGIPL